MRKFLILLAITGILFGIKFSGDLLVLESYYPDAQYIFFLGDNEISVDIKDAKEVRKSLSGIKGEYVRFYGNEYDVEDIIKYLSGAVIRREQAGEISIVYGYSAKLGGVINLNKDRINFQIALNSGVVTIGSPLIAGSY